MKTPICNFVKEYAEKNSLRLHMPGHKGRTFLGIENLDITEINGADSLYQASGIIAESEKNASEIFGCNTYFSTEGSSQCIRAMMYLAVLHAHKQEREPIILAGRNAHKAFHSAAALLDVDVQWVCQDVDNNYLSCNIDPKYLEDCIENAQKKPTAVYITSPDYLGNIADIRVIADVCHKYGVLLIVDNAHGAYLKFLSPSQHPMDLGADMCCDSAHKTLSVLTGGAYLHVSSSISEEISSCVKDALLLFGSTSPSYLILQSLDNANAYLENYGERLAVLTQKIKALKKKLSDHGYSLYGEEPAKITLLTKPYGYYGYELAAILEANGIMCEFADPDFLVFMLTSENESDLKEIQNQLLSIPAKDPINELMPSFSQPKTVLSVREACLTPFETVDVKNALGRISSISSVGCPPAIPIVISGEIIDERAIKCFEYYGIKKVNVIIK